MTNTLQPANNVGPPQAMIPRQRNSGSRNLQLALRRTHGEMILGTARAMADASVARQKVTEIDHIAREAITGQIMLATWCDTLAGNNQLLHDEISLFRDIARMSKAQIIADLVDIYATPARFR